ncbi:MAG: NADH-quinone oxidoreductase subunit A [Dehalococcoidia bacterium]|nr:NADH-quinone oxidoreductase subunit A [Dehalococcoidia bacterium]
MPIEFGRLGILLLFAIAFPLLPIVASYVFYRLKLRPQNPNPVKLDTYECGVETIGPSDIQFNARYYLIALAFVIFDVEALFLFPWAVSIGAVGIAGFFAAALFIAILGFGLAYDWAKGGLEWK